MAEGDLGQHLSIADAVLRPDAQHDRWRLALVLEPPLVSAWLARCATSESEAQHAAHARAALASYRQCCSVKPRPSGAGDAQLWSVFQVAVQHSSYWLSVPEVLLLARLRKQSVQVFVADEHGALQFRGVQATSLDVDCPWILRAP